MDNSKISVVIPCYNAEKYLHETVQSILGQTIKPYEVIIVDDGSTDTSRNIAESFGGIVRVIHQSNMGESTARNRGIDESKGDFIAFIDADDVWDPQKLEKQLNEFKKKNIVCVHSSYYRFGLVNGIAKRPEEAKKTNLQVESLILRPLVNTSTAIVKQGLPVRFPEWTRAAEDMIYFAEISLHGEFSYIPDHLTGYRIHTASQTSKNDHAIEHIASRLKWIEEIHPIIGDKRFDTVEKELKSQLIKWLNIAKHSRNWEKYWILRNYAVQVNWAGDYPPELIERIYSPFLYRIKDSLDNILKK